MLLPDYSNHRFMSDTGWMIKKLNSYTRALFICNKHNVVLDVVVSQEITNPTITSTALSQLNKES